MHVINYTQALSFSVLLASFGLASDSPCTTESQLHCSTVMHDVCE